MNDVATAEHWTAFLSHRPEIVEGERLLEQFKVGIITRICDCGCNSYDIKVPNEAGLEPLLTSTGRTGESALSIAFNLASVAGSLEFNIFLDAGGYLSGVDVSCNSNSEPVPASPQMIEPPYLVYGPLAKR